MIHFFLSFGRTAEDSPFVRELKRLEQPYRIFTALGGFNYRHRLQLLLWIAPKLLLRAVRLAWASLVSSRPPPEHVVVCTHLEALVCVLLQALLPRRLAAPAGVHLLGFIFTRRANTRLDALRRVYLNALLPRLASVMCHSQLEVERYALLFPRAASRFVYVPLGLHIHGWEEEPPSVPADQGPVFSAGRSGRDYPVLTQALAGAALELRIACDAAAARQGCTEAPNIHWLTRCFGQDYVRELRAAAVVAVPLAVGDISAGQMVLLQAMAFGKPVISTQTATLADYLQHEETALLVPPGDAAAWRAAVERLRGEPAWAQALAVRARQHYAERHSMAAMVRGIVDVVQAVQGVQGLEEAQALKSRPAPGSQPTRP
jgi:glycosyltransferase involved in cell wall biosynthesis